ncbi:hypothetical protein AVEN_230226-1 [Araneus ventricosus]|uniref:Uncharacterized protein n=1 Tax=Araneus ventricosus TaxID=182803 RepID=A0A4Y2DUU3_ARAVE|nr:hypothetical protein AVEN_230226-1 [Araneus ventricosus]
MENASLTGSCSLLKLNGRSVGIKGIRGIKTVSPFPVNVQASITLGNVSLAQSLVPLHSFGESRFRNDMIGHTVLSGNDMELMQLYRWK